MAKENNKDQNKYEKQDSEGVGDFLRKLLYLGAGTVVYTQEGMSKIVSENLKIPKEVANALIYQIDKGKQELVESFETLLSNYLRSVDLVEIARKASQGLTFDITVRVRYEDEPASDENAKS